MVESRKFIETGLELLETLAIGAGIPCVKQRQAPAGDRTVLAHSARNGNKKR
jgi:hypothetical protein